MRVASPPPAPPAQRGDGRGPVVFVSRPVLLVSCVNCNVWIKFRSSGASCPHTCRRDSYRIREMNRSSEMLYFVFFIYLLTCCTSFKKPKLEIMDFVSRA